MSLMILRMQRIIPKACGLNVCLIRLSVEPTPAVPNYVGKHAASTTDFHSTVGELSEMRDTCYHTSYDTIQKSFHETIQPLTSTPCRLQSTIHQCQSMNDQPRIRPCRLFQSSQDRRESSKMFEILLVSLAIC